MAHRTATYDLDAFKAAVAIGDYKATAVAFRGAIALGFDRTDIESCILALDEADFYKTMPAQSGLGRMQDVYKPTYLGVPVYVKVQHDGNAFVISFKKDESR